MDPIFRAAAGTTCLHDIGAVHRQRVPADVKFVIFPTLDANMLTGASPALPFPPTRMSARIRDDAFLTELQQHRAIL